MNDRLKKEAWLGIDFGTIWSKAALFNGSKDSNPSLLSVSGIAKDFILGGGKYELPTAIFVDPQTGELSIGKKAINKRLIDPRFFFDRFKLEIGQGDYINVPNFPGKYRWIDFVAAILKEFKNAAEYYANSTITNCVITVPAIYLEGGQEWNVMLKAAEMVGFIDPFIVREPESAAIYVNFVLDKKNQFKKGDLCLIYDLGGGTFDPALIEKTGDSFILLGEYSNPEGLRAGGIFIDQILFEDFLAKTPKIQSYISEVPRDEWGNIDIQDQKKASLQRRNLRVLSEFLIKVKHYFSDNKQSTKFQDTNDVTFDEYLLSRGDFYALIENMIDDTVECCDVLIKKAGKNWKDLSKIILVGGSSKIPLIKDKIHEICAMNAADQVEIISDEYQGSKLNSIHSVALGASTYSYQLPSNDELLEYARDSLKNNQVTEAEYYFRKANHFNSKEATFWLGLYEYQCINRRKVSYRRAFSWFEKGAKERHLKSLLMMSLMNFRGEGIKKSNVNARYYLEKIVSDRYFINNSFGANRTIFDTVGNFNNFKMLVELLNKALRFDEDIQNDDWEDTFKKVYSNIIVQFTKF